MEGSLRLRLLGTVQVEQAGEPVCGFESRKALALLCYLAVRDQPVSRSYLADLFWGDKPEARGRGNLSRVLHNLLTLLPSCLQADRHTVQLCRPAALWLDIVAFNQLAASGSPDALTAAVALYRDDFMTGFYLDGCPEFDSWLVVERERWHRRGIEILQELIDYHTYRGEYQQGLGFASRLLELDPWREEVHRQVMYLLARSGQRCAALAQYDTCRRVLAEELDVEPAEETTVLYERIRTGELEAEARSRRGDSALRHNLPPSPTPFVGREKELARIARRLEDPACRLLTLTGPGGIGKTRLALQAASHLIEAPAGQALYSAEVYFADLTPISSTASLVATIAETLNFSFYADVASRQQLLDYLRGKEMLLGLDNFEHLLSPSPGGLKGGASAEEIPDGKLKGEVEQSGATKLVADILTTAPAVKIMVTSREALNLQGEWLFPVNGLPFPPSDATENRETTATLEDYSAVQLFEQCARRACPGFSLAAEREDVVRICQMVEGMPLGIELAAAWLKMFSCEKITQELERGLDLLTTSLKDVPDRHRSMRAVFEHSWHLLPETERGVFRRLSVFRGGFRQEAAERVAEASFSILVALREKSLLHLTPAGRYQMHELLRQFVEEKLQIISQEQVQTQKRHSDYYLTFLQQKAGALKKGPQKATLVEISEEVDNVRSSWNWAIEQEKMALNDQVVESLFHYYWLRGNFQEGKEAFEKAAKCLSRSERIQKLDPSRSNDLKSEKLLGKVLARLGEFCYSLGQVQEAKDLLQNSLSINRPLKAYGEMAFSLNILGGIVRNQGEIEEGKQLLQKSLALYEKIGDQVGVANALTQLGTTVALRGEHQEAKQLYQEALALSRKLDNQSVIAYVLNRLGTTLFDLGEYGEAEQSFQKALRISEDIGKQFEISLAIGGLALIAWQSGGEELLKAKSLCEQSLAICRKTGNRRHISSRLCFLGRVACDLGEYQEAQAYYQEGLVILRERGLFWGLLSALNGLGQVACGLEDFQKARSYLQQSLETAMSTQRFPFALDALGVWATVLAREEALLEAGGPGGEGKKARAVELLALVLHHPASWQVFKDSAAQLLAELEAELPPGVVAAALERGKARKLEDVVAKILAEG